MAGHSKWANIQHRKGRQDEKRGKVWTRADPRDHGRRAPGRRRPGDEPAPAAGGREGQGRQHAGRHDQEATSTRPPATSKACNYEEIRYEGYGIGGAAIIVDCMTDNRVRTVAEVRHAFSKYGGNMGTEGSVAFQFKHCGQFVFAPGTSEDKVMEVALEAGADDVITDDDGAIEVLTAPRRLRGGARRRSRRPA